MSTFKIASACYVLTIEIASARSVSSLKCSSKRNPSIALVVCDVALRALVRVQCARVDRDVTACLVQFVLWIFVGFLACVKFFMLCDLCCLDREYLRYLAKGDEL